VTVNDQNAKCDIGIRNASVNLEAAARTVLPVRRAADFIPHDDCDEPVAYEAGGPATQVVQSLSGER
jgi:hypothetical protein